MTTNIVTRFSPSPSGNLHIGGVRTALFNYLFAKHYGGRYLVRIEDTDKDRSNDNSIKSIKDGLNWLSIDSDEDYVYQSNNIDRHVAVANELLAKGKAYKCYLTDDDLSTMKSKNTTFRSPWRNKTEDIDKPYTVRIKVDIHNDLGSISDMCRGKVEIKSKNIDDFVLLRSNGLPTYLLASAADDYDMGITHVIRGEDHLTNAFRQRIIYDGMGWDIPVYAHIPLIHNKDGTKMSKRRMHVGINVDYYKDEGFLPDAMINYLAKMGWKHEDDELFDIDQAISWFDGTHLGKSPAKFDMKNLRSVNNHYMRKMPHDSLIKILMDSRDSVPKTEERLIKLMPAFLQRAYTINELQDMTKWLFHDGRPQIDDLSYDDIYNIKTFIGFAQHIPYEPFTHDGFMESMRSYLEEYELTMKQFCPSVRLALSGNISSIALFDIINGLGKDEVLSRIYKVISFFDDN